MESPSNYQVLDLSVRQTIEQPSNTVLDLSVPKGSHLPLNRFTVNEWITDNYIYSHNSTDISCYKFIGGNNANSLATAIVEVPSCVVTKEAEDLQPVEVMDQSIAVASSISDLSSVSSILSLSQERLSSFIPSLQNIVGAIDEIDELEPSNAVKNEMHVNVSQDATKNCLNSNGLQSKTPRSLYFCKYCRQWFYSAEALREHKKIHMNTDKPKNFVCKYCKMAFKGAAELKIHERTHTGEKPYSCDICGLCFAQSGNLTQHRKLHLGFKPLACDICDKRFMRQYDMLRHRDTHTGYRPYKCEICDKTFVRAGHLTLHKRSHFQENKFDCPQCDQKFVELNQLTEHKKSHLDKSSNYCQECNLTFSCANEQHEHLNTFHVANFLPFACDFCDKRYKQSRALEKHRKTHQIPAPSVANSA